MLEQLFEKYKLLCAEAEAVKAQIEAEVLVIGKTTKLAGVEAKFFKPSFETPDYKSAAIAANVSEDVIKKFTTVTESVKWAEVCAEAGIEAQPGAPKPPRVTIKIL